MMMLILCLLALAASIGDVRLTTLLLLFGMKGEINPFMRWSVRYRPWLAYLVNVGGTAIACIIGLAHRGTTVESRGWWLIAVVLGLRLMSTLQNYRAWRMR
jgi:hypothetical protein